MIEAIPLLTSGFIEIKNLNKIDEHLIIYLKKIFWDLQNDGYPESLD